MTVKHCFGFAFLLMAVALSTGGRADSGSEPAIVDVAEKLNLTSVGDFYKVGGRILVCVEDSTHGKLLWDPAAAVEPAASSTGCRPPDGARLGNALVDFAPVEGSLPVAPRDTGFSGGASIVLKTLGSTHCGPTLPTYYTVTYPNGSSFSFYLIARLKKPRQVSLAASCEAAKGEPRVYSVSFDEVATLSSIDIRDGSTLLLAYGNETHGPVVLQVHRFPQSVWTSDHNVFVVPQALVGPMLEAAGDDVAKRYESLLRAIGES
jgi:hypothetical protein